MRLAIILPLLPCAVLGHVLVFMGGIADKPGATQSPQIACAVTDSWAHGLTVTISVSSEQFEVENASVGIVDEGGVPIASVPIAPTSVEFGRTNYEFNIREELLKKSRLNLGIRGRGMRDTIVMSLSTFPVLKKGAALPNLRPTNEHTYKQVTRKPSPAFTDFTLGDTEELQDDYSQRPRLATASDLSMTIAHVALDEKHCGIELTVENSQLHPVDIPEVFDWLATRNGTFARPRGHFYYNNEFHKLDDLGAVWPTVDKDSVLPRSIGNYRLRPGAKITYIFTKLPTSVRATKWPRTPPGELHFAYCFTPAPDKSFGWSNALMLPAPGMRPSSENPCWHFGGLRPGAVYDLP